MNARIFAAAGIAALALPAGALAHPGKHGRSTRQGRPDHARTHDAAQRCAKAHTVAFGLRGTFGSWDGTTLTLTHVRANRHARPAVTDGAAAIAIGDAKVDFSRLQDANGDGTVGWDDVTSAERVVVHGRIARVRHGCPAPDAAAAPTIRRVKVVARPAGAHGPAGAHTPASHDGTPPASPEQES